MEYFKIVFFYEQELEDMKTRVSRHSPIDLHRSAYQLGELTHNFNETTQIAEDVRGYTSADLFVNIVNNLVPVGLYLDATFSLRSLKHVRC